MAILFIFLLHAILQLYYYRWCTLSHTKTLLKTYKNIATLILKSNKTFSMRFHGYTIGWVVAALKYLKLWCKKHISLFYMYLHTFSRVIVYTTGNTCIMPFSKKKKQQETLWFLFSLRMLNETSVWYIFWDFSDKLTL